MMPRKIAGERTSSCKSIIIIHKPKTEQRNMHQLSLVNEANSYLEESPVLSPPQARNSIEDLKGFKLILETANSDQEA